MKREMKDFTSVMKKKMKQLQLIESFKNKKDKEMRLLELKKIEDDKKRMIKDLSCYKINKLKFQSELWLKQENYNVYNIKSYFN
jgi:hypothetical protein